MTGWGWGSTLWAKPLDHKHLGIIDAVPVLHTRPVGKLRDLHRRCSEENDRILADHQCASQMVTFAGIGPDLQDMPLSRTSCW